MKKTISSIEETSKKRNDYKNSIKKIPLRKLQKYSYLKR